MRFLLLFITLALTEGCSVGPEYVPPCTEIPSDWKNQQSSKCENFEADENGELVYLDYWWQVFDDDELNELESWALENNRNLYVAFERIQEAKDLMGIAASYLYPQATVNPQTTNTLELIKLYKAPGTPSIGPPAFRAHELLYALPINLSYEVDLWGKLRDQYKSAAYSLEAQKKDYEVVMLSLTSSLATAYYQLRAADNQMDLLQKVIKTREKALEINKDRFEEKIVFYADVTLAAEQVDTALLQYEEVRRQRELLEDQIAVLIGVPASEFSLEHMPLTGQPPCIPEGIPSEIMLRRPDIAEAEYKIFSQHYLAKEAYAQFFPSLILTATGGSESPLFHDFLKWISRYWEDGLQINQLIFDGFRTPYNFKLQVARFKEASGEYQETVLEAFQEVEDSLANIESYGKQYNLAVDTSQLGEKTYNLYLDRYNSGIIYYIDVVNTERDLLNFQITQNELLGFKYLATIQLIKALGGGW